jgi:hypothetical protein
LYLAVWYNKLVIHLINEAICLVNFHLSHYVLSKVLGAPVINLGTFSVIIFSNTSWVLLSVSSLSENQLITQVRRLDVPLVQDVLFCLFYSIFLCFSEDVILSQLCHLLIISWKYLFFNLLLNFLISITSFD